MEEQLRYGKLTRKHQQISMKIPEEENEGNDKETIKEKKIAKKFPELDF